MSDGQIPFLRRLAREDADALLDLVRHRTISPGTEILRAGSAGDEVVLVLRGRVRLVAYGFDRREVVLALRGPGELIGDMAALGAGRRTATGVALDEVEVGLLSAQKFLNFLREHPDAGLVMIRMLVRRLAETTQDVVDLATQDSVGRLAKRLVDLSSKHGVSASEGNPDRARADPGRAGALDRSDPGDRIPRAAADAAARMGLDRPPDDNHPRRGSAAAALRCRNLLASTPGRPLAKEMAPGGCPQLRPEPFHSRSPLPPCVRPVAPVCPAA